MDKLFAARTRWQKKPNRITSLLEQRRSSGLPVLDLTESNPTRCGFDYPGASILEALALPEGLVYAPEPRGLRAAREAIAADYTARGVSVSPERIVLTAGTSQAYSFLLRLLADPGDSILVPAPSYPLFELLGTLHDVTPVPYELRPDLDFAIDADSLKAGINARTRAILIVHPGNPTGTFLRQPELELLESICDRRSIPLICDEVFHDYKLSSHAEQASTLAGRGRVLTFVLNGLSKMLALPQVKLAWLVMAGPHPLVAEAARRLDFIADTYLSLGTPAQCALGRLLALREGIQRQVLDRIEENRSHLRHRASDSSSCRPLRCEGGWNAIIRIPRTRTEEEWTARLLSEKGILVHPGYFFDFPGDGHLVVSLLPPPERFQEGIDRLLGRIAADA